MSLLSTARFFGAQRAICALLAAFAFLIIRSSAVAQESEGAEGVNANSDYADSLADAHASAEESLFNLTDRIDEFFDDVRTEEQREDDWVRAGVGLRFNSEGDFELSQKVRAAFNLSAISDRLKIIVGASNTDTDSDSREERENNADPSDDQITEQAFGQRLGGSGLLGLRYSLYSKDEKRLTVQGGYRFRGGLEAFAETRASIRRTISENWAVEPSQAVFWTEDDGFGESTRLQFDRKLFPGAFLRLRSEALWSETSDGFDLFQEIGMFREIGRESYVGVVGFADFDTHPAWQSDVYRYSLRVKTLIFGDWLYGELEPFLEFTNDNDHEPTPGIAVRLEGKFDRLRGLPPQTAQ